MWNTIIGYLFCIVLGLLGLGVAGWLIFTGRAVDSTDNLFLTLVALLSAVACFGYLGWQVSTLVSGQEKKK